MALIGNPRPTLRLVDGRLETALDDGTGRPARAPGDDVGKSAKIIGVELKARSITAREQAELAMFACQIPVPAAETLQFEVTLHTSQGDVTLGANDPTAFRTFRPTAPGSLGEHAARVQPGGGAGLPAALAGACAPALVLAAGYLLVQALYAAGGPVLAAFGALLTLLVAWGVVDARRRGRLP
jgi:hypothetical protein